MKSKADLLSVKKVFDNSHLTLLFPDLISETKEKIVYRKNGKSIEKIIEFDAETGSKVKTTHYDYFDDKKIRSIDEFDRKSGKKLRTVNYVLYKSIDEYDPETGKKIRTINFNVKDETKISSIQEYDVETGKIVTVSIYKRDGKTLSIIKNIDPVTEKVTNWVNSALTNTKQDEPMKYATRSYDNIKMKSTEEKEDIAKLIDNLYCNIF
jgi:hypothetical protein